jgi:hypothetical protein
MSKKKCGRIQIIHRRPHDHEFRTGTPVQDPKGLAEPEHQPKGYWINGMNLI